MNKTQLDPVNILPVRSHVIVKKAIVAMIALLGGIFLLVIFALLNLTSDLNKHADKQSQLLLLKALDNQQQSMRFHLSDNAEWGEAYKNLHVQLNQNWAWDEQNLGRSLYTTFNYEGVFIIAPDKTTKYSVIEGQNKLVPFATWLGVDNMSDLDKQLTESGGKPISKLLVINNQLSILVAEWIQPGGDSSVVTIPGPASWMVFVDKLSPEKLAKLGEEYGIHYLHTSQSSAAPMPNKPSSLLLTASNGYLQVEWHNDNSGAVIMTWVLPLLIFLMFFTLLLSLILLRSALQKARLNDESTFMLEQSRLALAESESRFRDVAETTTDWIWEADEQLNFIWLSERFPVITGLRSADWLMKSLSVFFQENNVALSQWAMTSQPNQRLTLKHCSYFSVQGHRRYCHLVIKHVLLAGQKKGFRGTATDVTVEVEAQQRISYLSRHDELTGLANRVRMREFLEGKLRSLPTAEQPIAMLSLDLDKFKPVNDIFGHAAGDQVLNAVSARLRSCTRESDLIARHGGDEFILIISGMIEQTQINRLCERIIHEISLPFYIQGHEIFIGASIGVALAPQDTLNASDLLRFSDIALYQAKNAGRNCYLFYQPDMGEQVTQRREMESEIREALRAEQFYLVYQPRYDIHQKRITSVEALIRWQHPLHGLLMPDQFIRLAEETGLIIPLTNWVLLTACRDIQRELPGLSVSVNISPVEFEVGGFVERIEDALEKTGLDPNHLELEVTENTTLKNPENVLAIMTRLRGMGVRFLIDDFGTGYSSLSYLQTFTFDGIKLDKSFIREMNRSESQRNVVKNMIGLGKAYALDITAEGVETIEQVEQLKKYDCDVLQGYYLGRPAPLAEISKRIYETQ
jgi:diguanylate cyclase (GGDEF)-like protein/PAS domain S-box-containing protein